jgi:hypothetical protein
MKMKIKRISLARRIKHFVALMLAKRELKRAARAYMSEKRYWLRNFDCGWTMYNEITVGRGERAQRRYEKAVCNYETLRVMTVFNQASR